MPTLCCHPSTDSKSLLDSYNIWSKKWCACPRTVIQGVVTVIVGLLSQKQFLDNWTTTPSKQHQEKLHGIWTKAAIWPTGIVWRLARMHRGGDITSPSVKLSGLVGKWARREKAHAGQETKNGNFSKCEENTNVERGQLHVAKDKSSPRLHPVFAYIDFVQYLQPSIHKWITLQTFHS
jgi:hypothetical protein